MSNTVSIHPYFKAHEGKLDELLAIVPQLVEISSKQDYCYFYDFSVSEDGVLYCREAYAGAEGLLKHCEEVDPLIAQVVELADVIRCEIHGPAEELEKLKEPMAGLNPTYFSFVEGIGRPS